MRVGFGYDLHPLVEGRPLILGGVAVPFDRGLDGHSDADVLCHAIGDALLGVVALGDIGDHFPDSDPAYRDASSLDLLGRIGARLRRKGFRVGNVDATIVAEAPKCGPFRERMVDGIAGVLEVDRGRISVKATTNEGLGPVGRGEAIAAYAVVLVEEVTE